MTFRGGTIASAAGSFVSVSPVPLYDMRCPDHGLQMRFLRRPARVKCSHEGCRRRVRWVPTFARVEGDGWFRSGYDIGLGRHIESVDHRKRVMAELHCRESDSREPTRKEGVIYSFGGS